MPLLVGGKLKNSVNKTANITPKEKKRRSSFRVQVLIVVGFLVLVWFSFGQNVLAPQKQASVPERLGELELVSIIEGPEALAQIEKLHGTDINLVEAQVASYARGSTERITVWVSRAESSDDAAELTRMMVEGINRGNSVFSNLQRLTVSSHEVFQVDGHGGEHFFYNSREPRERVVWLAIEAGDTRLILEQVIKTS